MNDQQNPQQSGEPGENGQRRSSLPFAVIFLALLIFLAVKGSERGTDEITEDALLYELYTGGVAEVVAKDSDNKFTGTLRANAKREKDQPFTVKVAARSELHAEVKELKARAQLLESQPLRLSEIDQRAASSAFLPRELFVLSVREPANPEDRNGIVVQRQEAFLSYVDNEGLHYAKLAGDQSTLDLAQVYAKFEATEIPITERSFDLVDGLKTEGAGAFTMFLFSFGPILLFIAVIWWFMSRQMRGQGQGLLNFGRSRAVVYNTENRTGVTFADVAGIEEAKEEVAEIIEFLKNPEKFKRLGGRIPRGVLLVGSPGTGKTLLAKAIAGEAGVPFVSISGSDFVEMFVGVGASRVRDLFEQARKSAPCIIFLDEIDAVGRKRGSGMGGGNDEREQTLHAILVEMDGFGTDVNIIVIAATNRPDVLDPALLRPGRFDREIVIDLPDVAGREQILRVHTRNVKLAPEVVLADIARGTPGFSGAELAALVNESAIIAAMKEHAYVRQEDLEEARDKVRFGRAKKSRVMEVEDKRITAFHEAGHALVNLLLDHTEPLHKVTIIPRGMALGVTMMLPEKDRLHYTRNQALDSLAVSYGGRVAEDIFCDDITSGATSDIQHATGLARAMITQWGMSDAIGPINLSERSGSDFLGNEVSMGREHSAWTAKRIDEEIERVLREAQDRAESIIRGNVEAMHRITEALLEYETITGEEVRRLYEGTPPGELRAGSGSTPTGTPPPLPPTAAETTGPMPGSATPPPAPPAPPIPPKPQPGGGPA